MKEDKMDGVFDILHIDDEPLFLERFEFNLRKLENLRIISVQNVEDAYNMIVQKMPDLLVADLQIENDYDAEPGIKFIIEVKKKYPRLPIMVLSARNEPSLREKLKGLTVCYQHKAYKPSALKAQMAELIQALADRKEGNSDRKDIPS